MLALVEAVVCSGEYAVLLSMKCNQSLCRSGAHKAFVGVGSFHGLESGLIFIASQFLISPLMVSLFTFTSIEKSHHRA